MAKKRSKLETYITRIEAAENWRDKTYREKWTQFYKLWRNYVDQLKDANGKVVTDRSNISVPYAFTMLETILPRLVETLFAARPYVTLKGIPDLKQYQQIFNGMVSGTKVVKPWEEAAKKMQTLLDHQHNVPMDIQDVFHIGMKIMGLYGTTVAYTGWKVKERTVTRKEMKAVMEPDPDNPGQERPMMDDDGETPIMDWEPTDVQVKEYDDPEVKFLDLGHFFVDPDAEDIDPARFCGHTCFMSKSELEDMEDAGLLKLDWKKIPKVSKKNEARNYRMSAIGIPTVENDDLQHDEDTTYEVHYYWEDDVCAIIINRGYLAKDGANPFYHKKKPYDKDVYTKVPGEFYGIGLMEVIQDQAAELNAERNQRIDYRSHSLRRMFKVRRGANINRAQLVWKQNGIIEVDELEDINTFDAPSISGDSFGQEEIIKQDMRDTTGSQDVVMGATSGGTATEAMRNDNNSSLRFKLIISSVEKRLLVGTSRKMIQMNQQFIEDVRLLPLFDKDDAEWPVISPEEIQGEFHLIAAGSSVEPMANKEAHKQRMVELFGVVGGDPLLQQFPIKRKNLLKKVLESFDIQDTEELLPSDEELNGMMQQQIIDQFMSSLPPEVAQLVAAVMQGAQPPMMPTDPASTLPPGVGSVGGGMNTAAMQEQGMQMVGGGV